MLRALKAVAVVGALVAAAIVAFLATVGSGSPPSATGSPAPSHAAAPSAQSSPLAQSSPSARIPPGRPEWVTIPAIGVHAAVRSVVSTREQGSWTIQPPEQTNAELRRVYWWREHAAPANPSKGTAYIYGHACTLYARCAFNHLHELAKGDLVRVTTVHGTLTYRVVAKPIRMAKTAAGIGSSPIYNYGVVNRLVLITCGYTPDGSSPFNWVVVAHLTAATPGP